MKKWIAFLLILVLGLALYGCDDPDNNGEDKVNITGVVIEGNPTQMEVGDTKQLTARVEPENALQEVVWSSKNEEIATVDETGLVTAVGEGLAEIVATSKSNNRHSRTVTIQVVKPIVYDDPTGVEISTSVLEFEVGSRINLKATVFPNEPNEETGTAGAR
ncbi:MAG TPA: Ig-like domain-containing protein, partial [Acholeplasmataceae bacterium]|nr:Ig-like domain-containing protein [Acholeplasmataceae bacterium]